MALAPTARVPAMVAVLSVVLVGLLPDAHVHTGGDRARVHRHAITHAAPHHHGSAVGHDGSHDHADARLLTATLNLVGQVASIGPWTVASSLMTAPSSSGSAPISRKTRLPTHDPPLRFTSSPAPPAVV